MYGPFRRTERLARLLAAAQGWLFHAEVGLEHGRLAEVDGEGVEGGCGGWRGWGKRQC
jgi:hypothetical protein